MATPPTFVNSYQSVWNTTTTPKTTSAFNGALGDVLVALAAEANDDGVETTAFSSSPTETWTEQPETTGTTDQDVFMQSATAILSAARTGMTVSLNLANGLNEWGFIVGHFTGSDGIGATAQTAGSGGAAPALVINTLHDNSAIIYLVCDWTAQSGAQTHRVVNGLTPTELVDQFVTTAYSVWGAYVPDAGPAGAKTVGLTAPAGQDSLVIAVEVRGTSVAPPPTTLTFVRPLTTPRTV